MVGKSDNHGIAELVIDAYNGSSKAIKLLRGRSQLTAYGLTTLEACRQQVAYCEKRGEFGPASFFSSLMLNYSEKESLKNLERLSRKNAYCAYLCADVNLQIGDVRLAEELLEFSASKGHVYAKKLIFHRSGNYNFYRKIYIYSCRLIETLKNPFGENTKKII